MNKNVKANIIIDSNKFNKSDEHTFLRNYITECETIDKKLSSCKIECGTYKLLYEQLAKDVKRYFELCNMQDFESEWQQLVDKLSKVSANE